MLALILVCAVGQNTRAQSSNAPVQQSSPTSQYPSPNKELEELRARLFSNLLDLPFKLSSGHREALVTSEWSPAIDIIEESKGYVIKVELPEINKKEVKVMVRDGMLSISGERKLEREERGWKYRRIERSYGSFFRSFELPDNADSGHVEAKFSDGLLMIRVAKTEQSRSKEVEVKIE